MYLSYNSVSMSLHSQENHNQGLGNEGPSVFKKIEKPLNINCRPEGFRQEWDTYRHEVTVPLLKDLKILC